VVAVAFQIAFRAEIHANEVFSFFKNHFWHQHIKTIQKVQTAVNFSKKKFKIWWNAVTNAMSNGHLIERNLRLKSKLDQNWKNEINPSFLTQNPKFKPFFHPKTWRKKKTSYGPLKPYFHPQKHFFISLKT
jgi:hypothetical protein